MPVIIGVGQINDRPADPMEGLDSVGLMAAAIRKADEDAGGGWLSRCDWLANVQQMAFPGMDVLGLLPKALVIAPASRIEKPPYGDAPIQLISDAANAIAAGEASVCIACGGEALRTAAKRPQDGGAKLFGNAAAVSTDVQRRYGLTTPQDIYPLYENATRAAWGQSLAEAMAESGRIWEKMSEVAAGAEGAWLKKARKADEIVTPSAENRPLSFPYTKLQVANSAVNQGAAVIVTSLATAREAGIEEGRIVYVGAGAQAYEAEGPLERDSFTGTPAMDVSIEKALEENGLAASAMDHIELYSCFPVVPKMARRTLGVGDDQPLTVHGGLTFGGGPLGNYMMHATAAMVGKLREGGGKGLLYGNGGYCTHHHTLVLSSEPIEGVSFPQEYRFDAEADARRGPIPANDQTYEGPATIETYTVFHSREGDPTGGTIVALTPDGRRVVSKVPAEDEATIAFLTDGKAEPVGTPGRIERDGETLYWRAA
ncbi:MAG: acetyl-CoA acetyltransferase [Alphaproteobacteria bacterium]|nr:acetyl-CoA acetyltransferase [Alphaproteobacteria bacterium]